MALRIPSVPQLDVDALDPEVFSPEARRLLKQLILHVERITEVLQNVVRNRGQVDLTLTHGQSTRVVAPEIRTGVYSVRALYTSVAIDSLLWTPVEGNAKAADVTVTFVAATNGFVKLELQGET